MRMDGIRSRVDSLQPVFNKAAEDLSLQPVGVQEVGTRTMGDFPLPFPKQKTKNKVSRINTPIKLFDESNSGLDRENNMLAFLKYACLFKEGVGPHITQKMWNTSTNLWHTT
jgi:hypothetical protein